MPRITLKARPTAPQLADRLRAPTPEGLEIYLDARDIDGPDWFETLVDRFAAASIPPGFVTLVEGPMRSLDGSFFDITIDSDANRAAVDRVVRLGETIGAKAACVHMIAPTYDLAGTSPEAAIEMVERCVPLTGYYAGRCADAGLVPTIENIPPIARMREGATMTSTVGSPPEHLARLADRVNGVRFTVDTSHAQLFLNAALGIGVDDPDLTGLTQRLAESSPARTFESFLEPLRGRIETAHVSDAEGLLGEGLPYGAGTMDLDRAVDLLLREARWIVAEIIEPDPDRSPRMRYAADRIRSRRNLMSGTLA